MPAARHFRHVLGDVQASASECPQVSIVAGLVLDRLEDRRKLPEAFASLTQPRRDIWYGRG